MKDELTQLREELDKMEEALEYLKIEITYDYIIHYCKTYKDDNGNLVEYRAYIGPKEISSTDIDNWIIENCASTPEVQYSECYYLKSSNQLGRLFVRYRRLNDLQSLCDFSAVDPCIHEHLKSSTIFPLIEELGSSASIALPEAKEELKRFLENEYNLTLDEKAIIDLY